MSEIFFFSQPMSTPKKQEVSYDPDKTATERIKETWENIQKDLKKIGDNDEILRQKLEESMEIYKYNVFLTKNIINLNNENTGYESLKEKEKKLKEYRQKYREYAGKIFFKIGLVEVLIDEISKVRKELGTTIKNYNEVVSKIKNQIQEEEKKLKTNKDKMEKDVEKLRKNLEVWEEKFKESNSISKSNKIQLQPLYLTTIEKNTDEKNTNKKKETHIKVITLKNVIDRIETLILPQSGEVRKDIGKVKEEEEVIEEEVIEEEAEESELSDY